MEKLTEKEQVLIDALVIFDNNEIITNPYSHKQVELEPQAVALYDYIKGCELLINQKIEIMDDKNLITEMRLGLGIFSKLYPDAYWDLLD